MVDKHLAEQAIAAQTAQSSKTERFKRFVSKVKNAPRFPWQKSREDGSTQNRGYQELANSYRNENTLKIAEAFDRLYPILSKYASIMMPYKENPQNPVSTEDVDRTRTDIKRGLDQGNESITYKLIASLRSDYENREEQPIIMLIIPEDYKNGVLHAHESHIGKKATMKLHVSIYNDLNRTLAALMEKVSPLNNGFDRKTIGQPGSLPEKTKKISKIMNSSWDEALKESGVRAKQSDQIKATG